MSEPTVRCGACGASNSASAIVCAACGALLAAYATPAGADEAAPPPPPRAPTPTPPTTPPPASAAVSTPTPAEATPPPTPTPAASEADAPADLPAAAVISPAVPDSISSPAPPPAAPPPPPSGTTPGDQAVPPIVARYMGLPSPLREIEQIRAWGLAPYALGCVGVVIVFCVVLSLAVSPGLGGYIAAIVAVVIVVLVIRAFLNSTKGY